MRVPSFGLAGRITLAHSRVPGSAHDQLETQNSQRETPMPLMISISGIRGVFGDGLDPVVLARFTAAYGTWARRRSGQANPVVVVGRDARVTGDVCARIVSATSWSPTWPSAYTMKQ